MNLKTEKNLWRQDIRKTEYAAGGIKSAVMFALILYVFYESFIPAVFLFPIWILYIKDWMGDISGKKEQEFREQFKDSIQAMASALKTGYSVENAIRETRQDISSMYGPDSRIRKEYDTMIHQLDIKVPMSVVLEGLAERTGQEDVINFVNVFSAAKKSGGDSISVIQNTVRTISEKIDTEKEIQTILASKKLEFEIMCNVPFVIILYMKLTFGEFLDVLYGNPAGISVMSICLALYLAAYSFGRKIIQIEI